MRIFLLGLLFFCSGGCAFFAYSLPNFLGFRVTPDDCIATLVDPMYATTVPMNHEVSVHYQGPSARDCSATLVRIVEGDNRDVPCEEVLHDSLVLDNQQLCGFLTVRPLQPLRANTYYRVLLRGQVLSTFRTASAIQDNRGQLRALYPLKLPFCSHASSGRKCAIGYLTKRLLALSPLVTPSMLSASLPKIYGMPGRYKVKSYQMTYASVMPSGQHILLSGTVMVPSALDKANLHSPLVVIMHGDLLSSFWTEWAMGLVLASQGYSVLLPDGLGYGVSKQYSPAYLQLRFAAYAITDAIAATRQLFHRLFMMDLADSFYFVGLGHGASTALATLRDLGQQGRFVTALYLADGSYSFYQQVTRYFQKIVAENRRTPAVDPPGSTQDATYFAPFWRAYLHAAIAYHNIPALVYDQYMLEQPPLRFAKNFLAGAFPKMQCVLAASTFLGAKERYFLPGTAVYLFATQGEPLHSTREVLRYLTQYPHRFRLVQQEKISLTTPLLAHAVRHAPVGQRVDPDVLSAVLLEALLQRLPVVR